MALINEDYLKLPSNYLFTEIARKINIFRLTRPGSRIISLDAGDTSAILRGPVEVALRDSLDSLIGMQPRNGSPEKMKELVQRIIKVDYASRGIKLTAEELFVSDSAAGSAADVSDLLSKDNIIGVFDPSYPSYIYSSVMSGRAGVNMDDGRWSNLVYVPTNADNEFAPMPPREKVDIIYMSMPHNPTGTTLTKDQLKKWVKYAQDCGAIIIYDASHAHYIRSANVPHSIYEIRGAQKCAIELRCFSKTTGYTGTNFSFVVIPEQLCATTIEGDTVQLQKIWQRRHTTKFSGMSHISLCSALALYSDEGLRVLREATDYYMENARLIRETLKQRGYRSWGGVDSPYIWVKLPDGVQSWRFFEQMLYDYSIVCTPGVGFCPGGEGYVRFSGLALREDVEEAIKRIN